MRDFAKEEGFNPVIHPVNVVPTKERKKEREEEKKNKRFGVVAKLEREVKEIKKREEEYNNKVRTYNTNIMNLDPDYSSFIPLSYDKILVRMFVIEQEEDNLIVKKKRGISVIGPQNTAMSKLEQEDKWQFQRKGIVISKNPANKNVNIGDIVQVYYPAVIPPMMEMGNEKQILPRSFTLSDFWEDSIPPTDIGDKSFGYFMLNSKEIDGFIRRSEGVNQ